MEEQQNFLTMFNFQHSQITQKEFEKISQTIIKISNSLCNIRIRCWKN